MHSCGWLSVGSVSFIYLTNVDWLAPSGLGYTIDVISRIEYDCRYCGVRDGRRAQLNAFME